MKLKRNILLGIGLLLVTALGVVMICGGCKSKNAEWNYTPNYATTDGTTDSTDDGTGQSTTAAPSDAFGDPNAPSADVTLEDKEDLDDPTDSTTGSTTGTTTATTPGGSTDSTTGETASPTDPSYDDAGYMTYESYLALTGPEQDAYRETFPTLKAFNEWFHAAKAAYEAEHPKETITDGKIDLG